VRNLDQINIDYNGVRGLALSAGVEVSGTQQFAALAAVSLA
jgi:hypothetical protein